MKQSQASRTISERKRKLYEISSEYQSALTSDIKDLQVDLQRWGKNLLVITGSLYLSYKVVKLMIGNSSKPKESKSEGQLPARTRESSVLISRVKEQIALFLLAIALKKLKDFLNDQKKDDQTDT